MNHTLRQQRALRLIDSKPHKERPRDEDYAAFAWLTVLGVVMFIAAGFYEFIRWVLS